MNTSDGVLVLQRLFVWKFDGDLYCPAMFHGSAVVLQPFELPRVLHCEMVTVIRVPPQFQVLTTFRK
jgi:hypothetical protein